ncbi:hypothetical protein [Acidianus infernus]|nr:hypothetical protein [Acidianus infernus]
MNPLVGNPSREEVSLIQYDLLPNILLALLFGLFLALSYEKKQLK